MLLPIIQVILSTLNTAITLLNALLAGKTPSWSDVIHIVVVIAVLVISLVILIVLSQTTFTTAPLSACHLVITCGTATP